MYHLIEENSDSEHEDCENVIEELYRNFESMLTYYDTGDDYERQISLKQVPKPFRFDPRIVKYALSQNGKDIRWATDDQRNDKELIKIAIRSRPSSFRFINEDLRGDQEFIIELMKIIKDKTYTFYKYISDKNKEDYDFTLKLCKINGNILTELGDHFKENQEYRSFLV